MFTYRREMRLKEKMKNLSSLIVVPAAIAAVALLTAASAQKGGMACCGGGMSGLSPADKTVTAKQLKDKQTALILINGGYTPGQITVRQGKPVELTFTGGKNLGCGGTVVFRSLKISKDVAVGKSVVIKFTPKAKGEIPFTCSMGMLSGKVIVK